eukprot:848686-Rhodomonas_salina.4
MMLSDGHGPVQGMGPADPGTDLVFPMVTLCDAWYQHSLLPYALSTRCPVLTNLARISLTNLARYLPMHALQVRY